IVIIPLVSSRCDADGAVAPAWPDDGDERHVAVRLVGCGYFPGAAENHVLVGCAWHLMGMVRRAEYVRFRGKDGVIGPAFLWISERFEVLRFRLMVKRGPCMRPQASAIAPRPQTRRDAVPPSQAHPAVGSSAVARA